MTCSPPRASGVVSTSNHLNSFFTLDDARTTKSGHFLRFILYIPPFFYNYKNRICITEFR